ncbi:MAG: porin [Gemmataceae bacterium]
MLTCRVWSGCAALLLGLGAALATGQPAAPDPPKPPAKADSVAERLQTLEEQNKKLTEQVEKNEKEHAEQMRRLLERNGETPRQNNESTDRDRPAEEAAAGSAGESAAPSTAPGAATSPVPSYLDLDITSSRRLPLKSLSFGPGFQFQTEDEAFRLQIHYESQVEGRLWGEVDQIPANNGMYLPRQRIFFNGNITKPIEYEFAINRGLGNLNVLNAFINIHFDDAFELRFGRYFVPLLYEQYAVSNYWLLTPERSLYSTNVGLNRQFGLMGWGYLFDKQLDYAAGVFNGTRNSFENLDKGVDFVGYLDFRPFQDTDSVRWLKHLNVGSSVAFGRQNAPPTPLGFRVGAGSPDTNTPGQATVPFLLLNNDVVERGDRLQGSAHLAYFYGGLSLLGEWQYGYGTYATSSRPAARVPLSGFYVAGGYFLTGEEVQQRTRVTPRRPLIPVREGETRGWGAWELAGRVSQLRVGEAIFTHQFADPALWSNTATTTEVGLNWYWNDYVKFYLFWLHGQFGEPVQYRPGVAQKAVDMFWLRSQLYF